MRASAAVIMTTRIAVPAKQTNVVWIAFFTYHSRLFLVFAPSCRPITINMIESQKFMIGFGATRARAFIAIMGDHFCPYSAPFCLTITFSFGASLDNFSTLWIGNMPSFNTSGGNIFMSRVPFPRASASQFTMEHSSPFQELSSRLAYGRWSQAHSKRMRPDP